MAGDCGLTVYFCAPVIWLRFDAMNFWLLLSLHSEASRHWIPSVFTLGILRVSLLFYLSLSLLRHHHHLSSPLSIRFCLPPCFPQFVANAWIEAVALLAVTRLRASLFPSADCVVSPEPMRNRPREWNFHSDGRLPLVMNTAVELIFSVSLRSMGKNVTRAIQRSQCRFNPALSCR